MPPETVADRYELEQPLGGGGMSSVWRARDRELGRRVAVKLLARDADRTRFEREARAVAALSHPNICQLYDYGEVDRGPYMVLELLPGGTLEDRLGAGGPLPDDEAARIAAETAAGLAHAHERGLVHRDLKPANILFDAEGRAKIADFGIARIEGAGVLTEAGTIMGTAAYISPEQAAGEPATPASDVYSFGAILYRMLTGRTPFVSDNALELVRMHREDEPPPVERFRPDPPPALAAVAGAALAKDPAQRPPDGAALVAELRGDGRTTALIAAAAAPTAVLGNAGAAAPTEVLPARPDPSRPPAHARRGAALPIAAAAVALLALGGGAAYVLAGGSGDGSGEGTTPQLSLPSVPAGGTTAPSATVETSTQETTAPTTTAESSTQQTSTTQQTTTQQTSTQTSTQQTSTQQPTAPATTALPITTAETTVPTITAATTTSATDTSGATVPGTTAVTQ